MLSITRLVAFALYCSLFDEKVYGLGIRDYIAHSYFPIAFNQRP
mgnify:CR=1 FL=1